MAIRPYEGMIAEAARFAGHNGDVVGGYMARPLGPGPYPGVVVIQEIFGMVTHTKELARKIAAEGYIAVAPDLYSRFGLDESADGRAVVQARGGMADSQAIGDMEGAASLIKASPQHNGKIGVIGHCSGGRHSLLFACNSSSVNAAVTCNSSSVNAAVTCYGGRVITDELTPNAPVAVIDIVPRLNGPLLGLFGAEDQNPSPAHMARLEEELKKQNKTHEFKTYDGAGHAFFADYRPSYRQEQAVDGWERVFAWFGKYLAG